LVTAAVQQLSEAAIAKLPSLKNLATVVRSKKNRSNAPRVNPTTLADIQIPQELALTSRDEQFLLHDSGVEDDARILVFGTQQNLEILGGCAVWSADATFKTCPTLFNQVWVIHGYYRGNFKF
jgi:hypothetical protein